MVSGTLGASRVVLAWTGEGCERARQGARALLDLFPIEKMLVVGIAGGLSHELEAGSLLIARSVIDTSRSAEAPRPDPEWFDRGVALGGVRAGTVLTSREILCDASAKARARSEWAGDDLAVVDLESAAYAQVAAENGVRFLVVRAVSDTADEDLPFDLNSCVDATGRVSRTRVVGRALLHPAAIGSLWRLRARVAKCAEALAVFTERLLQAERASAECPTISQDRSGVR